LAATFVDDVKQSVVAWRKAPLLPIVSVALIVGLDLSNPPRSNFALLLASALLGIFSLGWIGTQLVWYQRVFEGKRLEQEEVIPLTWSFIARYLLLICLAVIPPAAVLVPVAIATHSLAILQTPPGRTGLAAYYLIALAIATFILPAQAYSSRRLSKGIPIGLQMLKHGWPGNWAYVFVPAVVGAAYEGLYGSVPPIARGVLTVVDTLVALAFAGAIARYYLRHAAH
jgi:hypothetical protein